MDISIARLSGAAPSFRDLTFPRYRPLLESNNEQIVVVTACRGFRPVGLALVEYLKEGAEARLLSLAVDISERRRGVGSALLRASEEILVDSGRPSIFAYHSSRLPAAAAFEATLRRRSWEPPQLHALRSAGRCRALATAIADWPGIQHILRNTAFSIVPWSNVNASDDAAIERLSAEPSCRPGMSPKFWASCIEPRGSVAIRQSGELVGWVLTRLGDGGSDPQLHCESAYIRRDLWRTGVLAAGYLRAYEHIADAFGPSAIVNFSTGTAMPGMMALVRRRFAPVSLWVDEWLYSRKALQTSVAS